MNADIKRIISKAMDGSRISKNELVDLLKCDDVSEEAFAIRAAGGYLMRQRTQNAGVIFGQKMCIRDRVGTLRGTCAHHITVLLPELPPARRVAGCAPALPSACKRRNDPHDRAAPSNGDEPKGFVGKLKTCRMSPHAASRAGISCARLRLRLHTHGIPCTVSATSRRVPKASQASAPPA